MLKTSRPLLCAALLLGLVSCDRGTPVAPEGTLLQISASPTIIALGESSTITVVASRTTGSPLPGRDIRFSTTLGEIDGVASTDDDGVARATLTATRDFGQATVTAWSGASEVVTTDVTMGRAASDVTLQASPSVIPNTGGTVELLALVRDDNGFPLQGAVANFSTGLGTLDSGGRFIASDANGEIHDFLTVTENEILALPGNTFDVKITVSAGDQGTRSAQTTIRVFSGQPTADFTIVKTVDDPSQGNCRATFDNNSTGAEPLGYSWNFQNGEPDSSPNRNPGEVIFTACSNGSTYTVNLSVTNDAGSNSLQKTVTFDGSGT